LCGKTAISGDGIEAGTIFNRRYLVTGDRQPRGIGCTLFQRMQVLLDRINFSFAGRDTVVAFETGA
jgi:hypothetical protein